MGDLEASVAEAFGGRDTRDRDSTRVVDALLKVRPWSFEVIKYEKRDIFYSFSPPLNKRSSLIMTLVSSTYISQITNNEIREKIQSVSLPEGHIRLSCKQMQLCTQDLKLSSVLRKVDVSQQAPTTQRLTKMLLIWYKLINH